MVGVEVAEGEVVAMIGRRTEKSSGMERVVWKVDVMR
jgi:hypothetical protein